MARFTAKYLTTGLLLAASALLPAAAHAQGLCSVRESFFGTIERVQGNQLSVQAANGHWATLTIDPGARVDTHGYAIRPGAYVGAYGCVEPDGAFHASEITLSSSASLYNDTISGVVRRIEPDRLIVAEPGLHTTGIWYVPDNQDFRVGQSVTGIGMRGANGEFYPQSVNGHATVADVGSGHPRRSSVTLSGVIRRVAPGELMVWEPANHTTGTWFVHNAQAFRVGESVTGTGTQNVRGDFYPWTVR